MYKEASKQKLRFATNKGSLSVEQLWDLSLTDLDALAVSLETEHKESGKKSFLVSKSVKDKTAKLKFDIALDVLSAKMEEADKATTLKENKVHNEKILALIADKKDASLKGKSVRELEKMLK